MSVEQLLPYVHPDAVYQRVPLPDERNALWLASQRAFPAT
jgi:hypothetical protein